MDLCVVVMQTVLTCAWYDLLLFFIFIFTSLPHAGNSVYLTWVRHSSPKSSATHSYQCVWYFPVSRQWYGCHCLGFVMCAQMLMHAIAIGGCTETVRVSTGRWLWEKNLLPHKGLEPTSVLPLAFRLDAQPTALFPLVSLIWSLCTVDTCTLGSWSCVVHLIHAHWDHDLVLYTWYMHTEIMILCCTLDTCTLRSWSCVVHLIHAHWDHDLVLYTRYMHTEIMILCCTLDTCTLRSWSCVVHLIHAHWDHDLVLYTWYMHTEIMILCCTLDTCTLRSWSCVVHLIHAHWDHDLVLYTWYKRAVVVIILGTKCHDKDKVYFLYRTELIPSWVPH